MTFKSSSEHTEPIFNDLKILNLSKLSEYLISSFMFRYFHLHNLPEIFNDYFLSNTDIITQEMQLCFTKNSIGQIIINTHLLTKEQMCGIIFHCNTKKLDLFLHLKRH